MHERKVWLITARKATASAVNVAVVFTGTAPVYWLLGVDWWRGSCIALFFGYNLLLSRRCLGMRVAHTYQDKPTSAAYAALYTASTATLLFWIWMPLDLALANGLVLQLPCLMIWGNTAHGLLARRRTMTQAEHDFECIALRGQCPDCDAMALQLNGSIVNCKRCRSAFHTDVCHVQRITRQAAA